MKIAITAYKLINRGMVVMDKSLVKNAEYSEFEEVTLILSRDDIYKLFVSKGVGHE